MSTLLKFIHVVFNFQDYLGSFQVLLASVVTLSVCVAGHTSPAFVGLGVTYALQVSFYLNWIVRMTTETEMLMNSVERVHEYTKLSREPNKHEDGKCIGNSGVDPVTEKKGASVTIVHFMFK